MYPEHSSNGLRPSVRRGSESNSGFWRILRLIRAKGIIGAPPRQLASNSQSANTDAPPGFPFASFLYNLFLSWSNRLLHHCGLGLSLNIIFTLAHSLLQLQTPEPGQQTQQEFVLIGARLLQHQEDLQLLRDIMWQLWFLYGPVHRRACLPAFCQCEDAVWLRGPWLRD